MGLEAVNSRLCIMTRGQCHSRIKVSSVPILRHSHTAEAEGQDRSPTAGCAQGRSLKTQGVLAGQLALIRAGQHPGRLLGAAAELDPALSSCRGPGEGYPFGISSYTAHLGNTQLPPETGLREVHVLPLRGWGLAQRAHSFLPTFQQRLSTCCMPRTTLAKTEPLP